VPIDLTTRALSDEEIRSLDKHGPVARVFATESVNPKQVFALLSNGDIAMFEHIGQHWRDGDLCSTSPYFKLADLVAALKIEAKAKAEVECEMAALVKRCNKAEKTALDLGQMLRDCEIERDSLMRELRPRAHPQSVGEVGSWLHALVGESGRKLIEEWGRTAGPTETVLEEAARLTSSDRQATYGHPLDNHGKTAAMWTAYLGDKLNGPLTPREVCWLNVLQKGSRDTNAPKRDNLTDGCGYLRNAEMITEEEAARGQAQ
jgi:hypothetical protein